jgi:hypothetical protein
LAGIGGNELECGGVEHNPLSYEVKFFEEIGCAFF